MRSHMFFGLVLVVSFLTSIVALPYLSNEFIIHWDIRNEPNWSINKYIGVFLIPAIILITWIIYALINHRSNKFLLAIMVSVFFLVHLILILLNLDIFDFGVEISALIIGIIVIILSPPMKKTKINSLYGIRTIWSMKNEEVWRRSNHFGANVMTGWGIFCILAAFLIPPKYVIAVALSVGLVLFGVIFYATYYFYKQSMK